LVAFTAASNRHKSAAFLVANALGPSPACPLALVVRRTVLKSSGRLPPTRSPLAFLTPAALMPPQAPITASGHCGSLAATLE
jgi:hypothetical protein